jgi:hypothetical protein
MAFAAIGTSAAAAVIQYNGVVDLDPSMIDGVSHNLIIPLPGGPVAVNVGDTIEGTITFANQGRVTVSDGDIFGADEWIRGNFGPDLGATAFSTGTFELLGTEGDFLLPGIQNSSATSGALGFGRVANFTNSSFSFSGVSFSMTYVDNHTPDDFPLTTHVTPGQLTIAFAPVAITEGVPEPQSWALALVGFLGAGTALRRQREKLA